MNQETRNVLAIMLENDVVTSSIIAEKLQVSEKTARSRIKAIAYECTQHGSKIVSIPGKGYRFVICDQEKYEEWKDDFESHSPTTSKGRTYFLAYYLLMSLDYVLVDDLAELLFVARNTISNDLKQVEKILKLYNLTIERRPNYGIRIKGDESNKRICISNLIYRNIKDYGNFKTPTELKESSVISEIIKDVAREDGISMTEISLDTLVVHFVVAVKRITAGFFVKYNEQAKEEIRSIISVNALKSTEKIINRIEEQLNVQFSEDELLYISLHFSSKTDITTRNYKAGSLVISNEIDELVGKMLETINDNFGLDYRNNFELRMSLNQHMVPFDIRMRYHVQMQNPLLEQIKKEYVLAYNVAVCASGVLEKHYNHKIPQDEIGYLAIILALEISKRQRNVKKYNIIIVCVSGKGTSRMFVSKYKQAFKEYINTIQECSVYDLETYNFAKNEIDFVFTTVPLNVKVPVPIYEVPLLLTDREIDKYQKIFEGGDTSFLLNYFAPNLFLSSIDATTKQDVLKHMCEKVKEYKKLPENYYEMIMKREELGQTDFGNLIALPHAIQTNNAGRFVCVGILNQPVWWGNNKVQVVLLVNFSENGDEDTDKFYTAITNFFSDINLIQSTISNPTFNNLLKQLEKAYQA